VLDGGASSGSTTEERFGRRVILYATINKTEGWRKAYVEASFVDRLTPTGPLPDGLTLILEVENYADDAFLRVFKNGSWTSARFPRNGSSVVATTDDAFCRNCHNANALAQSTFTLPALKSFAQTRKSAVHTCTKPGPSPCGPEAYR
jgi:hypothetical protein